MEPLSQDRMEKVRTCGHFFQLVIKRCSDPTDVDLPMDPKYKAVTKAREQRNVSLTIPNVFRMLSIYYSYYRSKQTPASHINITWLRYQIYSMASWSKNLDHLGSETIPGGHRGYSVTTVDFTVIFRFL